MPDPVLDGDRDLGRRLVRAVEDELGARRPAQKREVHLAHPEGVAARALLGHDVADRERVVGLVGVQHLDVRIARPERVEKAADVVTELALAQHVKRGSEGLGQLDAVAPVDPQVAVVGDADELGEMPLEFGVRERDAPGFRRCGHDRPSLLHETRAQGRASYCAAASLPAMRPRPTSP